MSGVNEWLISLSEYIGGMSDELNNAKAENVKLRELSKDLFSALFNEASRQHVTTIGEMQGFLNRMAELNILHEASKLGIEADE